MSVVLELEPSVEKALKERAASIGFPFNKYVANILTNHVDREQRYKESMAPLWKAFKESGMTENELDTLIEKERTEIWEEKHGKREKNG